MVTAVHKKIDFALKNLITEAVSDVLSDPDYGFKVKRAFQRKLLSVKRNSGRGISLAAAKKKYL